MSALSGSWGLPRLTVTGLPWTTGPVFEIAAVGATSVTVPVTGKPKGLTLLSVVVNVTVPPSAPAAEVFSCKTNCVEPPGGTVTIVVQKPPQTTV